LDGDLYQDHYVAEHSVASVAIDLLPHLMWNDFNSAKNDTQVKPIRTLKTKSRFDDNKTKSKLDDDNPPLTLDNFPLILMKYQSGRDQMFAFDRDPALESYEGPSYESGLMQLTLLKSIIKWCLCQAGWMMSTIIQTSSRETKWHTAIQKELQVIKWKSSPSHVGIAGDAAHLFTTKIPSEWHWMLIKKFIWKAEDMEKVSQEWLTTGRVLESVANILKW